MTIPLMTPGNDVGIAKKVLIPATVAAAIGIASLGGFQHTGERVCTNSEMCRVATSVDRLDANGHAVAILNSPGR